MSTNEQLVTTTRAARRLNVTPRTLLRWLDSGQLPGVRTPGGHWRVDPADLETFIAAQQSGATLARQPSGRRIVVVEDNAHHAAALSRLLRLLEPTAMVQHAADGITGGLLLGITQPGVVFVDIELPRLDGIELIRRALEQPALHESVFVVVSGHLSPPRIAELKKLGVRHILPKPINPEQIRSVLDGVFARPTTKRPTPKRRQEETHG